MKACIKLPTDLIKSIEARKKFRISETKNGLRTWVISTVDGLRRELLTKRGDLMQDYPQTGGHPVLKRQDRLGKEPFAGFGTVMEDIKRSVYTKNQPILLGPF